MPYLLAKESEDSPNTLKQRHDASCTIRFCVSYCSQPKKFCRNNHRDFPMHSESPAASDAASTRCTIRPELPMHLEIPAAPNVTLGCRREANGREDDQTIDNIFDQPARNDVPNCFTNHSLSLSLYSMLNMAGHT